MENFAHATGNFDFASPGAAHKKIPLMNIEQHHVTTSGEMPHEVEIEMHSGQKFIYSISAEIKSWLEEWVIAGPFDPVPAADCFLCFGAMPCRTIFARMVDIRQVTVTPENIGRETPIRIGPANANSICTPPPGQPSAVIMLRKSDHAIVFRCLDPADNTIEINEVNLWQPFFFKSGFLHFKEDNGSSRYVPVTSISVMDVDRELVYPRDPWGD